LSTARSAYEAAREEGELALKRAFLAAAERLLLAEGPAALTVRRIAAEVGCSTKVVYTTFGGKNGLSEALYLEGFGRLRRRLMRVPADGSVVERLRGLSVAYRDAALADPGYYRVMFQGALPGFVPRPEARARARSNFEIVIRTIAEGVAHGELGQLDPERAAEVLWAGVHGVVSLELAGYLEPGQAADRYHAVLEALLATLARPL
jgi:AcrR family transcriptional regulator